MNLVHNSTNASNPLNANSVKWAASGGWGLSGTKYGAFSCTTCHIPKTSNILRIKTGITVLDTSKGNIPGGSNSPVNFQSRTLTNTFGNYSAPVGGYSNSQRICETCHSATSYHKYTQTKIRHEEDAALKNCIICHEHNKGFKPIGACTICHARPQGARAAVLGQFTTSGNSHHVQGVKVTDQLCYQCHWEANIDGTVNTAYHGGSLTPGAPVRLVRYKNGLRPTVYKDMTSAVLYTANGSRTEFQKINNHCLGCHSAPSNSTQPFGDGKTPKQYAWDGKSIDERYSQTGTTPWGKYSDTATTNVSPKDTQIKAFSAHGNAGVNKRGWNLTETWPNTSGSVNVLCYDCHNSHGSAVSGVTSNYSSATGKYKGAILKATTAGKGGYSVTYKPQAGGSAGTKDAYNPGAGLCFDCHNTATAGTKPWGYTGTYGSTQAVLGYWDTPYFTTGTFAPTQRYAYKAFNATHKGGHFGVSSAMLTTPSASINGLCTPCHDPHGVSPTLSQAYAVPLLKGTWLTSPYLEDAAPVNINELRGGGSQAPGTLAVGSTPQYHIDQNTFGQETYPAQGKEAPTGTKSIKWSFADTTNRVAQTSAQFGGLCLNCHSQASIAPSAASAAPAWKSLARVHNTVKGWGSTGTGNANSAAHSFTCSKCHTTHNYRLPRLMVTNCLDYKLRGQVNKTAAAPVKRSQNSNNGSGGGGGGYPGGGGGIPDGKATGTAGEDAAYLGAWFFGSNADPTGYRTCHDVTTAGGTTYPTGHLWNTKTPW
ncbi:MAG: hypothetical protein A2X79_04165 [Desulfuromonadaceae bacterium GWB2_53_15]|nr:MAG: hypothetical protein A2X79_04165 [Desulfuromonadaceae bacterium GWB2_53_15]